MEWLTENWITVAAIVYAALSEIIGMNPNWKNNSVIQIVLGILGKVFIKKPA